MIQLPRPISDRLAVVRPFVFDEDLALPESCKVIEPLAMRSKACRRHTKNSHNITSLLIMTASCSGRASASRTRLPSNGSPPSTSERGAIWNRPTRSSSRESSNHIYGIHRNFKRAVRSSVRMRLHMMADRIRLLSRIAEFSALGQPRLLRLSLRGDRSSRIAGDSPRVQITPADR